MPTTRQASAMQGTVPASVVGNPAPWLTALGITATASLASRTRITKFNIPRTGVMVMTGDSNTKGRPGWQDAVDKEWSTAGGAFEGWTIYNRGANGSILYDWAVTTTTGNSSTPTTTDGNAWAVKNLDPDVIIICLGTNDVNTVTGRATNGTVANLRANLATLVNFYLNNTRAMVWLRMPAPMGTDTFDVPAGIPNFANNADCDECNQRFRTVYREWDDVDDRVLLWDSHKWLFGNTHYASATSCYDPLDGTTPLMYDSLHPNDLGYRRTTESMAHQIRPHLPALPATNITAREEVFRDAFWSVTLPYTSRSSNTFELRLNPQYACALESITSANGITLPFDTTASRVGPVSQVETARLLRRTGNYAQFRQLIAAGGGSGISGYSGSIWMYFHSTGNLNQVDYFTLSQIVSATPDYAQIIAVNPSPAFNAGDTIGFVTFFVTDPTAAPWNNWRATPDLRVSIPDGATTASLWPFGSHSTYPLRNVYATRASVNAANGGVLTVELRECNQGDGRYVAEATYNTGKVIASVTFSNGIYVGTVTLDPSTHYGTTTNIKLNGNNSFLRAFVTAGAVTGDVSLLAAFR